MSPPSVPVSVFVGAVLGAAYALSIDAMPTWLAVDIPIWVVVFLLGLWLPRRRR